jgi:hypothetical protein
MTRLTTAAAILIFAVSFYFGLRDYQKSSNELKLLRAERQESEFSGSARMATGDIDTRNVSRLDAAKPAPDLSSAVREARLLKQKEINDLQAQLDAEKRALDAQAQTLNSLVGQKSIQERQARESYSNTVANRTNEIQDLTDFAQLARQADDDMVEAMDMSLRDQSNQALWAREQIDQDIRATESSIRQTQEQIQGWSQHTTDVTLRDTQLQALQTQLQAQQTQLAALFNQRSEIATRVFLQGQQITQQVQESRQATLEGELEILSRMTGIREELSRLKQNQQRNPAGSPEILEQIQAAQASRNEQAQKVQALEESLHARQSELQELR